MIPAIAARLPRRFGIATLVSALLPLASGALRAQNSTNNSVQFSVLMNALNGDDYTNINMGLGAEAQLRRQVSLWSFGGGVQYTRHSVDADAAGFEGSVSLAGVFVEPRRVFPTSSSAAPYLSARLAFLRQGYSTDLFDGSATGFQGNVGGGVLIRANPRTNFDIGATYGIVNFGSVDVSTPGAGVTTESGSGTNLVLRFGVSVGVGR